jgi:hypothetical protein
LIGKILIEEHLRITHLTHHTHHSSNTHHRHIERCHSNELFQLSFKKKKYQPVLTKPEHGGLVGEYNGKAKELWVGPVVEKGKNLPSKKNLVDYIDEPGRMQLLTFFL